MERSGSPRRVAVAERRAKAVRLRAAGLGYEEIARQVGLKSADLARVDVHRALAALRTEPVEEMRALESERLDFLWRTVMQVLSRTHYVVSNGKVMHLNGEPMRDDDPALRAVAALLQIQQRRAKLHGLDAPKQVEVITLDAVEAEIRRLSAELGRVETDAPADVEAASG